MTRIRWGVLSTAKIGTDKVIPAMQNGRHSEITAIASRSAESAAEAAARLGLEKSYGSYEELLADQDIDAVYNPLPNHLHVAWSILALEAGKHVLCEKPIAMNAGEAAALLEAARRHPRLKVMEAFMYRHHPQWKEALSLVRAGGVGELRSVHAAFTYFNTDPQNIRNVAAMGGGGLMDIGCYTISAARLIFGAEPIRVCGYLEIDPAFGTDRLAAGMLDFGVGMATFQCGTQVARHQSVQIFGTSGRIELQKPFIPPADEVCRIFHEREADTREIDVEPADHYTIQGDLFSLAALKDTEVPTPLEDAVANMRVIDAVRESAETGRWVSIV